MFENLTVGKAWELLNTQFSLMGVLTFIVGFMLIMRLVKRSLAIIEFVAKLPTPLLAGSFNVLAAGGFGYAVMDMFAKSPHFSGQTNGFIMSASATLALVALKYERQRKEEPKQ